MKRGKPLARRTPLKPSAKGLARSPLKRVSTRKRRIDRANSTLLEAYRREFPECQCGECDRLDAREIHEIAAGSHREKARQSRACILHVHGACHVRIQGEAYAIGLARKLLADPAGFSLAEFLGLIGRATTAITIDEVLRYMPKKLPSAEDIELALAHHVRTIALLTRQLKTHEAAAKRCEYDLRRAQERERKIAEARQLTKE